jgi:hypothetical protein
MTTTGQRLKAALIAYLTELRPSDDLSVVDANQRTLATLPAIAVQITAMQPHSEALWNVERASVEFTLRVHAGDEDEVDLDEWIDRVESVLQDPSAIVAMGDEASLAIFHWQYLGATQDFTEAAVDTTFSAECLVTRKAVNPTE